MTNQITAHGVSFKAVCNPDDPIVAEWSQTLGLLIGIYRMPTIQAWFSKLTLDRQGGAAVLVAPSHFHGDWLRVNYWTTITMVWPDHRALHLVDDRGVPLAVYVGHHILEDSA